MEVYVVTCESYNMGVHSGSSASGVFSTEADAEAYADRMNASHSHNIYDVSGPFTVESEEK